jgi:hypothetical protein
VESDGIAPDRIGDFARPHYENVNNDGFVKRQKAKGYASRKQ